MTISKLRLVSATILATAACLMLATPSQALNFMFPRAMPALAPAERAVEMPVRAAPAPALKSMRGLPQGARPLSGQELFELYVGKTWKWGEGGGYFGPHGAFRARTYGDKGETVAGGTWAVNDKGRMCFRAVWTNSSGSSKANTCFDHMMLGGDVYQRKMPKGEWYVFRHGVPTEGDEYNKLAGENLLASPSGN